MDDKEHTYTDGFPNMPFGLTVIPWILWAVMIGLAIGGAFYASKAIAQPVVVHSYEEPGKLSVRLMSGKCVDEVSVYFIMTTGPQFFDRAKALESSWLHSDDRKMHPYAGCWLELTKEEVNGPEPMIFMVFADGQRLAVPKSVFTKKPGTVGV